ncbi:hypothetical protein EVAR_100308_1 [Eumeta japonica]|uniref:Uncharacterized protein n=1 Tax=Eumeta variegata TaxID=151549 RepID=A0A4C1ZZ23_EUMVA|nr:hypothetical protein EVAR_100308_1 [Eumeta japonica]
MERPAKSPECVRARTERRRARTSRVSNEFRSIKEQLARPGQPAAQGVVHFSHFLIVSSLYGRLVAAICLLTQFRGFHLIHAYRHPVRFKCIDSKTNEFRCLSRALIDFFLSST